MLFACFTACNVRMRTCSVLKEYPRYKTGNRTFLVPYQYHRLQVQRRSCHNCVIKIEPTIKDVAGVANDRESIALLAGVSAVTVDTPHEILFITSHNDF